MSRRTLPGWLSLPVVICGPLVVGLCALMAIVSPVSVLAAMVPLLLVGVSVWWLSSPDAPSRSDAVAMLAWGACFVVVVGVVIEGVFGLVVGDFLGAVLIAPVVEEVLKWSGLWWLWRRGRIQSAYTGAVMGAWVGLGFAVVEDQMYFTLASVNNELLAVFVLRALVSPFAHSLFTCFAGMGLGWARDGKVKQASVVAGLGVAVLLHAAWNAASVLAGTYPLVLVGAAGMFLCLFVAMFVVSLVHRARTKRVLQNSSAELEVLLGGTAGGVPEGLYRQWSQMRAFRRTLPNATRSAFDAVQRAFLDWRRVSRRQDRTVDADTGPVALEGLSAQETDKENHHGDVRSLCLVQMSESVARWRSVRGAGLDAAGPAVG